MIDVRKTIKAEIEKRGFNQSAIAKKAGRKPQQFSDVLNLRRKLEANEMLAVCAAMEIDISSLARAGQTE